jgi:hypothetical protein
MIHIIRVILIASLTCKLKYHLRIPFLFTKLSGEFWLIRPSSLLAAIAALWIAASFWRWLWLFLLLHGRQNISKNNISISLFTSANMMTTNDQLHRPWLHGKKRRIAWMIYEEKKVTHYGICSVFDVSYMLLSNMYLLKRA